MSILFILVVFQKISSDSFREEISLISEDTQLCQDIIAKGYEIYISKDLKLKYKCRNNIFGILSFSEHKE